MTRTARRGFSIAILASGALLMGAMSHEPKELGSIRGFSSSRAADEHALEEKFRAIPDPAHAESNLRHLTSEPHLAGTEASKRVAEWLRGQYQSYGSRCTQSFLTASGWPSQKQ